MPDDTRDAEAPEATRDFDADTILNLDAGDVAEIAEAAMASAPYGEAHQRNGMLMLSVAVISLVRIADALETIAERKG